MSETKRTQFLEAGNVAAMIKRVYNEHQREGGNRSLSYFQEQVAGAMQTWPRLEHVDSYESLTMDPETELESINQDFYREAIPQWLPAGGFARVQKLETVDDYLNFDIQRDPAPTVNASMYRDGNRIPVNRKPILRHYDRSGEGVHGRSIGLKNKEMLGMDELWDNISRPYRAVDENDAPYGGTHEGDDSTLLMSTAWN